MAIRDRGRTCPGRRLVCLKERSDSDEQHDYCEGLYQGRAPLLIHHFGPDALPLEKQEKDGVAGNSPNEWRKTALVTKEGQLYLKPAYAFATIRDAARHTKKGKGSIQSAVAATLQ